MGETYGMQITNRAVAGKGGATGDISMSFLFLPIHYFNPTVEYSPGVIPQEGISADLSSSLLLSA